MNVHKKLLAATLASWPLLTQAAMPELMMGTPTVPSKQLSQENARMLAELMAQRGKRGLNGDHAFVVAKQHPGVKGTRVIRADHTYKGVRVFGSESVIVSSLSGDIVSESVSERRAGLGKGPAGKGGFNVMPTLGMSKAISTVLRRQSARAVAVAPPSAELIIYPIMKDVRVASAVNKAEDELNALDLMQVVDRYVLAYLVSTRMSVGNKPVFFDTVVDARDARIIDQWSMVQTAVGTGQSQYNGMVPLNTTLTGTTYWMRDPDRGVRGTFGAMAITNANHTTSPGSVYTNASNAWGDGKQYIEGGSTTNANGQTAAVNAMWGLMNTYDMHRNVLGWQSLDGNNTATFIAAHVNTAYDNAYYSDFCKCMFIGDGSSFTSLGAIDVVGHEMAHGVTAATSNLTYRGESGGLNESSSDITGDVVEAYARAGGTGDTIANSGNDWVLAKEISKSGTPLRYMYKPSKDGRSPDAWSAKLRGLDVHYSSGPNNRMFYFLSQGSQSGPQSDYYSKFLVKEPLAMTGIGTDKAFRIWFKANTTKFTSTTNYADARSKMVVAAQELYGIGSKEAKAVERAYAAINVGSDVDE
jgi:Zn-dependent metalloprotease